MMKQLILVLLVFAAFGCGSGSGSKPAADIPEGSDLQAEITIRAVDSGREIDVLYYISSPVAPGAKTSPPKKFIEVEDATYNGTPMTLATNESGTPIYKADPAKWAPVGVIGAKLNGKTFEGRTPRDSTPGTRLTAITLSPKQ